MMQTPTLALVAWLLSAPAALPLGAFVGRGGLRQEPVTVEVSQRGRRIRFAWRFDSGESGHAMGRADGATLHFDYQRFACALVFEDQGFAGPCTEVLQAQARAPMVFRWEGARPPPPVPQPRRIQNMVYSMSLPLGWKVVDQRPDQQQLASADGEYTAVVTVVDDIAADVDAVFPAMVEALRDTMPGFSLVQQDKSTLAGVPSRVAVFESRDGEVAVRSMQVVAVRGKVLVTVSTAAPVSRAADAQKVFSTLLASFSWKKAPQP